MFLNRGEWEWKKEGCLGERVLHMKYGGLERECRACGEKEMKMLGKVHSLSIAGQLFMACNNDCIARLKV